MDQRDQQLLDRQLGHIIPPPRNDGVLMLAIAAIFFAGIAIGGVLFAGQSQPLTQIAATAPPSATFTR